MAITTKRILGVATVKLGDIETDGGMSLSLSAFGDTVRDSVLVSNTEGTKQEFFIEESDDAVESITSAKGATTAAWSTTNTDPATMEELFGGTAVAAIVNGVATHGAITGGTLYTNGSYLNVPLTGGTGTGATANITVAGGSVTVVTIVNKGTGYTVADVLSALAANIGGTGSGFSTPVATLANAAAYWDAPDTIPDIERSVEITDSRGNKIAIARAKLSARMDLNFKRTALGTVAITATVLVPTKVGEPSMRLTKIAA